MRFNPTEKRYCRTMSMAVCIFAAGKTTEAMALAARDKNIVKNSHKATEIRALVAACRERTEKSMEIASQTEI